MKRTILLLVSFVVVAGALPAFAQVVPSATGRRISLSAGGMGSAGQPDYASRGIAETSPNRLYGFGAYVDFRLSRWVQLEAEVRQLQWNQQAYANGENTYAIGLREPIHTFGRITPYGKALVGFGSGSFLTGRASMYAMGGGVDYRLNKRFTLRAFDFEFQQWRVTPTLRPYEGSVGLSYKIF